MLLRKAVTGLAIVSLCACGGGGGKAPASSASTGGSQTAPVAGVDSGTVTEQHARPGRGVPPVALPPVTQPPVTQPPVTQPPVTQPPVTQPPVTQPPVTQPPVTQPPVTQPPVTQPPVTQPPVTQPPVTQPPAIQGTFQRLPLLDDADGNPNNLSATYNLTVDNNVPVTVNTPAGTWTTPMMRFNSLQVPPLLKAKRGTTVTINVKNNLAEDTTVHWHGFKIPGAVDGGPDSPIAPGATVTYTFKIDQPAASLWFHPHAEGTTATQVYAGLAGGFVVTDDITDSMEATKQLPSGNYDIPLVIQDRLFEADTGTGVRRLVYGGMMAGMRGMIGDRILVNGVQAPTLNVESRQYRLRLFNGSNARVYLFGLSNGASFNVIGTDGGLLPAPVATTQLRLSPGERSEIVVDLRGRGVGDSVSLVDLAFNNAVIAQLNVTQAVTDDITLYTALPQTAEIYQRWTAPTGTVVRPFVMNMVGMMQFAINSKVFDPARIDEVVNAGTTGTTEVWEISNATGMAHPFHAHAIQWQILDRNGAAPTGIDLGWKDTVLVLPGETVRFIGRFDPVVNKGLYYYHCHILEHEEAGMMGSFEIR